MTQASVVLVPNDGVRDRGALLQHARTVVRREDARYGNEDGQEENYGVLRIHSDAMQLKV